MAWGSAAVNDATIRDVVRVAIGGSGLRVRVSNLFGTQPLGGGAATVGTSAGGAAVAPGSLQPLTFAGAPVVSVPVGGEVLSDPVVMAVTPGLTLAVSVYGSGADVVTIHYPCCEAATPSYYSANRAGNLTAGVSRAGFVASSPWSRLVDAIDVLQSPDEGQGSIVVVGDSITDGFQSTLRWTDVLQ